MDLLRSPIQGNIYNETAIVHFPAEWAAGGTPADPGVVTFLYQIDGGAITTLTYDEAHDAPGDIIRDSEGNYYLDLDTTGLAGSWLYVWKGTGGGAQAAGWKTMTVVPLPL
jgi:hypothetical protein